MTSRYVPAGPEAAPTSQTSQAIASPTLGPQSSSSSMSLLPSSIGLIAALLSLLGLAALGTFDCIHSSKRMRFIHADDNEVVAGCWIRGRQTTTKFADVDEQPPEKPTVGDVEALAATRQIIPIIPLPDVRWAPQIRSISGPAPDGGSYTKLAALPPKRARSPAPSNFVKPPDMSLESFPKSAPAYALSFSQNKAPCLEKSLKEDMFPAVTPQAISVSGMQTRSLGRYPGPV